MTLGDLREIASLFNAGKPAATQHPFVGKFCIARCYAAGVHAGKVISVDGENVILEDSIRMWSWKAKDGVALSGVAQNGIDLQSCKIDTKNPLIYLTGVCELIPCSKVSIESTNVA
jgi:hypothetical protein